MNQPQQPGCLPEGYTLDSMLTVEQFALWQGRKESAVRRSLDATPGVVSQNRQHIRIHPRTFLAKSGAVVA